MADRPFDARQSLLSDRPNAASSWRTVSLVTALREFVSREPNSVIPGSEQYCDLITLCADELTDRGIDANSLIRYGLGPEVVAGAVTSYIERLITGDTAIFGPHTLAGLRSDEWARLLEELMAEGGLELEYVDTSPEALTARVSAVAPHLMVWCLNAPLADLIELRPPSREWLAAQQGSYFDGDVYNAYRWMVERFSITRLESWGLSSLHLEHEWLNSGGSSPCNDVLMGDRAVLSGDLDREIARRAVRDDPTTATPQLSASLASRLHGQASAHLRGGRFEAAATLFEFAVSENPHDPTVRNNLGFCTIPHDPDLAWQHLSEAARLGYEPAAINVYNRVLCLMLLGQLEDALNLAESEWDEVRVQPAGKAMLWVPNAADGVRLAEDVQPVSQLAALGVELSLRLSRPELVERWRLRRAA